MIPPPKLPAYLYASLPLRKISKWIKDDNEEIMGDRYYPFSSVRSEGKELISAIKNLDKENIKEELQDLSWTGQAYLHQRTGLNWPTVFAAKSLDKYRDRAEVWKRIFENQGVEFNKDYLSGGSNYRKHSKIKKALANAGVELSDEDAGGIQDALGIDPENEG